MMGFKNEEYTLLIDALRVYECILTDIDNTLNMPGYHDKDLRKCRLLKTKLLKMMKVRL